MNRAARSETRHVWQEVTAGARTAADWWGVVRTLKERAANEPGGVDFDWLSRRAQMRASCLGFQEAEKERRRRSCRVSVGLNEELCDAIGAFSATLDETWRTRSEKSARVSIVRLALTEALLALDDATNTGVLNRETGVHFRFEVIRGRRRECDRLNERHAIEELLERSVGDE